MNNQSKNKLNHLQKKYAITAWFYDFLDYPWERQYRKWRPQLVGDLQGKILEAGVGTGHNIPYYSPTADVLAIDLSPAMLAKAKKRQAPCPIEFRQEDACTLSSIDDNQFDWIISTFLCCVLPDELQPQALDQFARVLKPGGRFRLLEMVYSKQKNIRRRQQWLARYAEKVFGARFDRQTMRYIENHPQLVIDTTSFLKDDTYLLIEGHVTK